MAPTSAPTLTPTAEPTTFAPTLVPTSAPTTVAPTSAPTLCPTCGATMETWTNIAGEGISDFLTNTNNLANTPNESVRLTSLLQRLSDSGTYYGSRISGWLVAPVTGTYTFWIAADNSGEFWLSTDDDAAKKVKICFLTSYSGEASYDENTSQKSADISLVAGQAYYFEVSLFDFCYLLFLFSDN